MDNRSESAHSINKLTTTLGVAAALGAAFVLLRTLGLLAEPWGLKDISPIEAVELGLPVLAICLLILLAVAAKHNLTTSPSRRLERIPPVFTLELNGNMADFRILGLLAFFIWPAFVLLFLLRRFLQFNLATAESPPHVLPQSPFAFPAEWYHVFRWHWGLEGSTSRFPACPGLQPLLYVLLVVLSVFLVVCYGCWILRPLAGPGTTKRATLGSRLLTSILCLRAKFAIRYASSMSLMDLGRRLARITRGPASEKSDFWLARALAYFGDVPAGSELDKSGAAYGLASRGKLREAIALLEGDAKIHPKELIHHQGLLEVDETCRHAADYNERLAAWVRFSRNELLLGVLSEEVFRGRLHAIPAELNDVRAFLERPPEAAMAGRPTREIGSLQEATPGRVLALRKAAAWVREPSRLALIVPVLAILLDAVAHSRPGATSDVGGGYPDT